MKKLLFSLLLFAPAFLFAQKEAVIDTSWVEKSANQFFAIRKQVFEDQSELVVKDLIGDTTALVDATKSRITSKAATMAVDVNYVSSYRKKIGELLREADAVRTLTGIDPQREVQKEYDDIFLASGWTIKRDGATQPIEFTLNAQDALRFSVNGGTTKPALLLGKALRLKDYPIKDTHTDVYELPNGVWVDATRLTVLRPPNNDSPVNR